MMDGHITYQGLAKDSTIHFAKAGLVCPIQSNPSDYFMRILSVNYPKTEDDERHIELINSHYQANLAPKILSEFKLLALPEPNIQKSAEMTLGYWQEFKLVMWRELVGLRVDPLKIWIMLFQCIF
jgi:hypothetical protein